jgi:hypothetical protein
MRVLLRGSDCIKDCSSIGWGSNRGISLIDVSQISNNIVTARVFPNRDMISVSAERRATYKNGHYNKHGRVFCRKGTVDVTFHSGKAPFSCKNSELWKLLTADISCQQLLLEKKGIRSLIFKDMPYIFSPDCVSLEFDNVLYPPTSNRRSMRRPAIRTSRRLRLMIWPGNRTCGFSKRQSCRSRSSIDSLYSTLSLSMGWLLVRPAKPLEGARTPNPLGLVYTNSVMRGEDVFPEVMAEALAGLRPAQPAVLDHQDCSSLYSCQRSGLSLWSLLRSSHRT